MSPSAGVRSATTYVLVSFGRACRVSTRTQVFLPPPPRGVMTDSQVPWSAIGLGRSGVSGLRLAVRMWPAAAFPPTSATSDIRFDGSPSIPAAGFHSHDMGYDCWQTFIKEHVVLPCAVLSSSLSHTISPRTCLPY